MFILHFWCRVKNRQSGTIYFQFFIFACVSEHAELCLQAGSGYVETRKLWSFSIT